MTNTDTAALQALLDRVEAGEFDRTDDKAPKYMRLSLGFENMDATDDQVGFVLDELFFSRERAADAIRALIAAPVAENEGGV